MPTILRVNGYRFWFFSLEHLPVHVHVSNADGECKFEIRPVRLLWNKGMKLAHLKEVERLVTQNEGLIEEKWNEYFG